MPPPSPRILVVDDNDALRENLAEALQIEGYPVEVAADGPTALSLLAEDPPPGIVLLDLMLPGMSGSDVLSRIRADARLRDVKVVLTTGASAAAARAVPADAVLMKPFGVTDLLRALRKVGVGA
jgi:two-component system, chemotaxis family, chemotaxis protein CheY